MIGRLSGQVVVKQPPQVVLDVHGVGYELQVPMSTLTVIGDVGAAVTLVTELVVRDDALVLYGFASDDERRLFRELTRVSGVGAKLALTVLSGMSVAEFVATVDADDSGRLTGLPGVGKKTAARLIVEMRDKLAASGFKVAAAGGSAATGDSRGAGDEARTALVALGYKRAEAERLLAGVDAADVDADADAETRIRLALKRAIQ